MSSDFHTLYADTSAHDLMSHMGETGRYFPYLGGSRAIELIVDREPYISIGGVPMSSNTANALIKVLDSRTLGISLSELDYGRDQIAYPVRNGEAMERRAIGRLVGQLGGLLVLEVR